MDYYNAIMVEDNGSTKNFIAHALAEKLSLARALTMTTTAIGGECKRQETYEYLMEVVDAVGVVILLRLSESPPSQILSM